MQVDAQAHKQELVLAALCQSSGRISLIPMVCCRKGLITFLLEFSSALSFLARSWGFWGFCVLWRLWVRLTLLTDGIPKTYSWRSPSQVRPG